MSEKKKSPPLLIEAFVAPFGFFAQKESLIRRFIRFLRMGVALYLSFRVNNGFNFGSFIIASLMPDLYIIYTFATKDLSILLPRTFKEKKNDK